MISKEQFRLLVASVSLSTGKSQEELATAMGYGKNYISEVLSPTGKLSDKFIAAFKHHYKIGSENPKPEEQVLTRTELSELIKTNFLQAEAILVLSRAQEKLTDKINLSGVEPASSSFPQANKGKRQDIAEVQFEDKIKAVKKKRKGILKNAGS